MWSGCSGTDRQKKIFIFYTNVDLYDLHVLLYSELCMNNQTIINLSYEYLKKHICQDKFCISAAILKSHSFFVQYVYMYGNTRSALTTEPLNIYKTW